jgi:predicted dehydrogenase
MGTATMIRVGICGFGYWGPTLYRVFAANPNYAVVAIADPRRNCRDHASRLNPRLRLHEDGDELIDATDIEAVVIATPVTTHHRLAARALRRDKHVMVEKPLAASVDEALELVGLADATGLTLIVDHFYLFHDAVKKLKDLQRHGELGFVSYYDSLRVNLGLFRPDMNVLWDLAPHDFSIMDYIFEEEPIHVEATGYCHVNPHMPDIAYVTTHYRSRMIAHLNLSWMSPVKVRRIAVGGTKRMVVWDDLNLEERLKIYNSGIEFQSEAERNVIVPSYRIGDIYSPRLQNTEPLSLVVEHFHRVIAKGETSPADGRAGMRVVKLLERAQQALDRSLATPKSGVAAETC